MLANVLLYMFPYADPRRDFVVRNDGGEDYISEWNLPQPQPTRQEIEAAMNSSEFIKAIEDKEKADTDRLEAVKELKKNRGLLLKSLDDIRAEITTGTKEKDLRVALGALVDIVQTMMKQT